MRLILVLAALGLLVSDLVLDADFFSFPANRTLPLMAAAGVRNLLLVAAAIALVLRSRSAAWLVGLCALLGLVRRASFLLPLQWDYSTLLFVQSGADLLFRFMLLACAVEWLRKGDAK